MGQQDGNRPRRWGIIGCMVLEVPFDQFTEAVKEYAEGQPAFVCPGGSGMLITVAGGSNGNLIIQTSARMTEEEVRHRLLEEGLEVKRGRWKDQSYADGQGSLWTAAIAYVSGERKPGLWVSAYETEPSPGEVLGDLYAEFNETGELRGITLEEFIRQASPNMLILAPEQMQGFAMENTLDRLGPDSEAGGAGG